MDVQTLPTLDGAAAAFRTRVAESQSLTWDELRARIQTAGNDGEPIADFPHTAMLSSTRMLESARPGAAHPALPDA